MSVGYGSTWWYCVCGQRVANMQVHDCPGPKQYPSTPTFDMAPGYVQAELDRLRAENAELRAMLAKYQYPCAICEECGGVEPGSGTTIRVEGHRPDCALSRLLGTPE